MKLSTDFYLKVISQILAPLVRWSISLGIDYRSFSRVLKPLFFQAALQELTSKKLKCNDSSLSLASGLHKGDIIAFRSAEPEAFKIEVRGNRISPISQIVARWLGQGLARNIPLRGKTNSFDALVRSCNSEGTTKLSTRLILQDMMRRGYVQAQDGEVSLISEVEGLHEANAQSSLSHFAEAVRDHIEVCLFNLKAHEQILPVMLEQSLQVDGLYPPSVMQLQGLTREWWRKAVKEITPEAIACTERDEPAGGTQRLRIGVYFYSVDATTEHPNQPIHLTQ